MGLSSLETSLHVMLHLNCVVLNLCTAAIGYLRFVDR